MKLNLRQQEAIQRTMSLFAKAGKEQLELSRVIGGGVGPADLSRAKAGYVPDKKWPLILGKFQEIAIGLDNKKIADEIGALMKDELCNPDPHGKRVKINDADYVGDPDLQRAAFARSVNQQLNPLIWNPEPPTSIYTVQITYPEKPAQPNVQFLKQLIGENWETEYQAIDYLHSGMKAFQSEMRNLIVDASGGETKIRPFPDGDFRGLLSPAKVQTMPVIYLIPFFLTADRRFDYGVVRYGSHKSIGLLISRATLKGTLHSDPDTIGPREFVELIRSNLKLYHVEPYSAEHILCQMLLECHDEKILTDFNDANQLPDNDFKSAIEKIKGQPANAMLVFDLADKFLIAESILDRKYADSFEDHKIIQLQHGVETDVGIGFSLRAFDWIVKDDRFKTLRTKALDLIDQHRDNIKYAGIEIDKIRNGSKTTQ